MKTWNSFVLLLLVIGIVTAYNKLHLPYQAHSINDLNMMHQELLKGTSDFKFDVSLASESSCLNWSNWDRDFSQCGFYDFGMQTCCLALRGDCSSQPVFSQWFNTTNDLISYLRDPKNSFMLSKSSKIAKYSTTKYFAFNFQYSSYSVAATTWFIYNFLLSIQELGLNLKFVAGTNGVIEYYDNKCSKSGACNYMELFIAQSDIILQDKGNGVSKHRQVQFNTAFTNLPSFCQHGFPEFAYKSDIPLQLWEPSFQNAILETLNLFWNEITCPNFLLKDRASRFRITSNLNSEQLAVSLQLANKTKENIITNPPQYVPPKHTFEKTKNSIVEHSHSLNATFISRQDLKSNHYSLLTYEGNHFEKTASSPIIFNEEIKKLLAFDNFLLVETTTSLQIFQVSHNLKLSLLTSSPIPQSDVCNYIGSTLVEQELGKPSLFLTACSNQVNELQITVTQFLEQQEFKFLVPVPKDLQSTNFSDVVAGIQQNELQVLFIEQQNNNGQEEIYFLHLSADLSTETVLSISSSSKPLQYGVHSSIKLLYRNTQLYFIQVSQNGSSWSGIFINNGGWYKCTLHELEDFSALRNIPYTLTYMWGQLNDLVNRINSNQFINSCDSRIISAKIYNGENPSISVIDDEQGKPTAYVMMNNVPFHEESILSTLFTGSNSYEAFKDNKQEVTELISFDLLEYELFDINKTAFSE